jgi:hypothetical protein
MQERGGGFRALLLFVSLALQNPQVCACDVKIGGQASCIKVDISMAWLVSCHTIRLFRLLEIVKPP